METVTRFAEDRGVWAGALGCFVLAGLTGAFFRFRVGYSVTVGPVLAAARMLVQSFSGGAPAGA